MEILLPKRNDSAQTEKLSSRTVTVVGANGAGKSRFGVEIARRIQDHAFWLSAQKALCIMPPHEVWPGSIEAMYQNRRRKHSGTGRKQDIRRKKLLISSQLL